VGLERVPLSLVSTTEELTHLYLQKLALTSPTSDGRYSSLADSGHGVCFCFCLFTRKKGNNFYISCFMPNVTLVYALSWLLASISCLERECWSYASTPPCASMVLCSLINIRVILTFVQFVGAAVHDEPWPQFYIFLNERCPTGGRRHDLLRPPPSLRLILKNLNFTTVMA
jgi:hypothetical protein